MIMARTLDALFEKPDSKRLEEGIQAFCSIQIERYGQGIPASANPLYQANGDAFSEGLPISKPSPSMTQCVWTADLSTVSQCSLQAKSR